MKACGYKVPAPEVKTRRGRRPKFYRVESAETTALPR
jgi:hypothetical protein